MGEHCCYIAQSRSCLSRTGPTGGRQILNQLTQGRDIQDQLRLASLFPSLNSSSEQYSLVLRCYLDQLPEKFFNRAAYESYLGWLLKQDASRPKELEQYLSQNEGEINGGLHFLRELNSEEWHDWLLDGNEYEVIRMIDKHVHPAYLRLIEGVWIPMVKPLAHFSRRARNKGVDGLGGMAIFEEIKGLPENGLNQPYVHIIRNGIAHVGITFLQSKIRYQDNRGNKETFDVRQVVRLTDDLVDTCNGIAAALKVFLLISQKRKYSLPREFLIEVLQEQTWAPWWSIEGCMATESGGRSQMTVYAQLRTRDFRKAWWSTLQSGLLTQKLVDEFDQYNIRFNSRRNQMGWAIFNRNDLQAVNIANSLEIKEASNLGKTFFFFDEATLPSFKVGGMLETLIHSFTFAAQTEFLKYREKLEIPRIYGRKANILRSSWGAVLHAEVIIEESEQLTAEAIRKHRRRIVRTARRYAGKSRGISHIHWLPLIFARVAVFARDHRRRRLAGFGLAKELICVIMLIRTDRIQPLDLIGSTVKTEGSWRISWNDAWLKSR